MAVAAVAPPALDAVVDHQGAHLAHPVRLDVLELAVDHRIDGLPALGDAEVGHELVHHVELEGLLVHAPHDGVLDRLDDRGLSVAGLVVGGVVEGQDHGPEGSLVRHVFVHHGVEELERIDAALARGHDGAQVGIDHRPTAGQQFGRELRQGLGGGTHVLIYIDVRIAGLEHLGLGADGRDDLRVGDAGDLLHQRVVVGGTVGVGAQGVGEEGAVAVEPEKGEALAGGAGLVDVGWLPNALLGVPGGVHPVAQDHVHLLQLLDVTSLAGETGDMAVEQRLVARVVVRGARVTGLAGDLVTRQVVGDQVDAHTSARDMVTLRAVAVGALDARGGVAVVLRAEGVTALGALVQDALVLITERLGRGVVAVGVPAHVVLVAAQTVLGADGTDAERGTHAPVLVPAQPALVADHHPLVHVVLGRVTDQTVDPLLCLSGDIADRHHLFRCRLVVAADVALAAALAAQHRGAGRGALGATAHQRGPAGPGEAAGDAAGAVDLADGDLVRPGIDLAPVVAPGGEAAGLALELEVDRVDQVVQGVDGLGVPVGARDVQLGVAAQTGLGTGVAADAGVAEILDVGRLGVPDDGVRAHQHLDLDPPREGVLIGVDGRLGLRQTGGVAELRGQGLELGGGQRAAARVGERRVGLAHIRLEGDRVDQLVGGHQGDQDQRPADEPAPGVGTRVGTRVGTGGGLCSGIHSSHPG